MTRAATRIAIATAVVVLLAVAVFAVLRPRAPLPTGGAKATD